MCCCVAGTPAAPDVEAPPSPPRQYAAPAFNAAKLEEQLKKRPTPLLEDETREFERYHRVSEVNWLGVIVFLSYLAALGFYIWVRITKTLDLGPYVWYGILVLVIECLGATTVILYGINLLRMPVATYHVQARPARPRHLRSCCGPSKLCMTILTCICGCLSCSTT